MVWEVITPQPPAGSLIAPNQPVFLHNILPYTEVEPSEDAIGPGGSDIEDYSVPNELTIDTASQTSASMEISAPSTPRSFLRPSPIPSIVPGGQHRVHHRRQSSRRPRRSTTSYSTRSSTPAPTAEPSSTAPLPASYIVHFLAIQILSDDPAQTLLRLTQYAPRDYTILLETLS